MIVRDCKAALPWVAVLVLAGCVEKVEPVRLDTTGVEPRVTYADLAGVLDRGVDGNGHLDMFFLKKLAGRLDAQLKLLAVTGPTATPELVAGPEERLAYWYNARAAWATKLAMLANCPKELSRERFEARPFPLDGRQMTLEDIDAILSKDDDWRVVVAAPCARMHRARMPKAPFTAADVRGRAARRFEQYIDEADRFVIDVQERRILVPAVLWQFRRRLIDEHNRTYATTGATLITALLPYVGGSPARRLQNAIGYRPVLDQPGGPMACQRHYEEGPVE